MATMLAGTDVQRTRQFSKTKLCKFELLGMCTKGNNCQFAHGQVEMRPLPDLRCTKLCASVLQNGHCNKADCTFAHSKEELRTTGAFHKTKPCRFMLSGGHCILGARCNFAHSPSEMRGQDFAAPPAPRPAPVARRVQFKALAEAVPPPPGLDGWTAAPRPAQASAYADSMWARPSTPPMPDFRAAARDEPAYVPLPGGLIVEQSGLSVEQSDDQWKITSLPLGLPTIVQPLRSVRTSESTLCSLADDEGSDPLPVTMAMAASVLL